MARVESPEDQQTEGIGNFGGSATSAGLVWLIVAGLLLRFVIAATCWGTNDANTFGQFGFFITSSGLIQTYGYDTYLNHPPIPAYWCAAAWRLTIPFISYEGRLYSSHLTYDTPGPYFSAVFKIPSLIAECLTVWLLYKLWRRGAGKRQALAVAAAYAWCLDAILVSGYHCNTDPIYGFLCLLAVYLLEDCGWHFLAGLALGAAINVKLTPVLLIPPLLLWHRSSGRAVKFMAGLAVAALPFVPVLYFAGHAFYSNSIAYKSNPDNWGITYLLMLKDKPVGPLRVYVPEDHRWASLYFDYGRFLLLALIGLWSLAARFFGRCRRWTLYEVGAVTLAIFLFFTPGFGVQYTAIVLPLLFAARPKLAGVYGLVAGLFLLVVYWAQWNGHWPPNSQFKGMFPWPSPAYGLAAWGVLGYYLVTAVCFRTQLGSPAAPANAA